MPQPTYDPQNRPVTPGLQVSPSASANPNISSRMHSYSIAISPSNSSRGSRQSYWQQPSFVPSQPSVVPSHQTSHPGSSRLSHARNNPSRSPYPGSPLAQPPSSSYSQRSPLVPPSASRSHGSVTSAATLQNHPSQYRPHMYLAQSAPQVSCSHPSIQPSSSSPSSPSHQRSPLSSRGQDAGQSSHGSYCRKVPSSRPSMHESQSAPSVSRSHKSRQHASRASNLNSQKYSSSSESLPEPSAYSASIATSRAQVGNMQRTYYEGMVPMTPSEIKAEREK